MGFKGILAAGAVALSFVVAGKANAVVIFSNVDDSVLAATATHTVGMSFAPTQSGILESILLPLSSGARLDPKKPLEIPPRVPETGIVSLWTATQRPDNVWVKNDQLEQWDITVFRTMSDPPMELFSFGHPILEAGERYWLFLENISWVPGGIFWAWDTTPTGPLFDSFIIWEQYSPPGSPWNQQFVLTVNAIAAVPEPATWAMMIFGFGFVGFMLRRARHGVGTAASTAL
jgi:hypothetical protein